MPLGRVSTPVSGITSAGAVSFQLYADATDGMDFASRENTTTGNRPQLTLTIATGGTTPPPAGDIDGAAGSVGESRRGDVHLGSDGHRPPTRRRA